MSINVVLECPYTQLAAELAAKIERTTQASVTVVDDSERSGCLLRYGAGIEPTHLDSLDACLRPFTCLAQTSAQLPAQEIHIVLNDSRPLLAWDIHLVTEQASALSFWRAELARHSFDVRDASLGLANRAMILYGNASDLACQYLRWLLSTGGIDAELVHWLDTSDDDVVVYLPDARRASQPVETRASVQVWVDDNALVDVVEQRLAALRVDNVEVVQYAPEQALQSKINVDLGPFSAGRTGTGAMLRTLAEELVQDAGIDTAVYPIMDAPARRFPGVFPKRARLDLPLAACASQRRRPYAPLYPGSYELSLYSDDLARVQGALEEPLRNAGFRWVKFYPLDTEELEREAIVVSGGEEALSHPNIGVALYATLQSQLEALGLAPNHRIVLEAEEPKSDKAVDGTQSVHRQLAIRLPIACLQDETWRAALRRRTRAKFKVRIRTAQPDADRTLLEHLQAEGFTQIKIEEDSSHDTAEVSHGPDADGDIDKISAITQELLGVTLSVDRCFSSNDPDIWIDLPARAKPVAADGTENASAQNASRDWWEIRNPENLAQVPALIEDDGDRVRIGDTYLPKRAQTGDLIQSSDILSRYCVDQSTAETLVHLAESVQQRDPCLLEGPTAASKTSAIQYLAARVGQPILRINLHGQTDHGELIGRHLPGTPPDELESAALHEVRRWLSPDSRELLVQAARDGRELKPLEKRLLAAHEGLRPLNWHWHNGLLVDAMEHGWWINTDEVNLADAHAVERLNSVLEREPSLVISEHDNRVIGTAQRPVNSHFRIFATMNPASYTGRSAMSPAFRDRWTGYRYCEAPAESDYRSLLHFLVFGVSPVVWIRGQAYKQPDAEPALPALSAVPAIEELLDALAQFHVLLLNAFEQRETGIALNTERSYVFTRRSLLAVCDYLEGRARATGSGAWSSTVKRALERYYLMRLTGEDRALAMQLLDGVGLGPNTWHLTSSETMQAERVQ